MSDRTPDRAVADKVARAELVKRSLIVLTAILVTLILVSQVVLIGKIRATQQTGSPVLKSIRAQQVDIKRAADAAVETNDQILDCLDPSGACYVRAQQQSAATVASVNEITYYAAVCADRPGSQTLAQIRLCVGDLITAARHPSP